MEVDKAVFFSIVLRVWQLAAGLVTALLMTVYFTKSVQGFYYTFASLVALQTFFELGFNIVIVNTCSHEWSRLSLGPRRTLAGDPRALSRLVDLGRLLARWYSIAAALFVLAVGTGGWIFLSSETAGVAWQSPWLVLVLVSGGLLVGVPFHAVLEGCNQVVAISIYRTLQAVAASIAVWLTMAAGGGLWAAVAAAGTRLAGDLFFLGVWYGPFFKTFRQPPSEDRVAWRTEIWPLQWRLAVQGVTGYFLFFFFTPLMFHLQDAEGAAEMGMTWTVVTALQAAALAWVQTRAPRFGMLISSGDYVELDRIFFRLTAFAAGAYTAGCTVFLAGLLALDHFDVPLAGRLLPVGPSLLLLAGAGAQTLATCQAIYVRAHKKEPFLRVGVAASLATGSLAWWLGTHYGATGIGCACLAVNALFTLPLHSWIVRATRRERALESNTKEKSRQGEPGNAESFAELNARPEQSFVAEFLDFLIHSPSWWLVPILLILLLFGLGIVLIPAEALPFIYTLW